MSQSRKPWANYGSLSRGHVLGDRPSRNDNTPSNIDQQIEWLEGVAKQKPSFADELGQQRHPHTRPNHVPYDWAKQGI